MGVVIPFRRQPDRVEPVRPISTKRIDFQYTVASLVPGLEQELLNVGIELDVTFQIEIYLNSLRGHVSSNSIATSRNTLKGMTIEELNAIAKNSKPDQWSSRPGYFRSLVDEIRSRM